MTTIAQDQNIVILPEAPDIPGLTFRRFRGEDDYPLMLAVIDGSKEADGIERSDTLEDIANNYAHLTNCDPYQDLLFAEVDGEPIAYSRVFWFQEEDGPRVYTAFGFLLPDWRRMGIGGAMLRCNEARLREIAQEHPPETPKFYQAWASDTEKNATALYESNGYAPVRFQFDMTRPIGAPIPEAHLPEGLEVRPVEPEHLRQIWEADMEAFRDHWGFSEPTEEDYQRWLNDPINVPDLWKIAWEGDQVAGMVQNFLHQEENREYGRQRGYTEGITVRRPWRRRGLARALIAQSIQMFREMGMEETALGVDAENPTGALRLYESMGYKEFKSTATYRKPLKI